MQNFRIKVILEMQVHLELFLFLNFIEHGEQNFKTFNSCSIVSLVEVFFDV